MKKKLIALVAAAVAVIPFTVSPAHAAAGGGTIVFECTADLPFFPSDGGVGQCGTDKAHESAPEVPSTAEGVLTGVTDQNNPFVIVVAGTDNFDATFDYSEGCVAGEPPLAGTAAGSAEITGLSGIAGTDVITGGEIKVTFSWVRAGATAVITITGGTIDVDGTDDTISGDVLGAGTAAFVPVISAGNTCPSGDSLKAPVVGTATVAVTP